MWNMFVQWLPLMIKESQIAAVSLVPRWLWHQRHVKMARSCFNPIWTLFAELGHSYSFFESCIIISWCELELSVPMSRLQYWGSIYLYYVSPLQHADYILCRCAGTERCNEAVERLKGKFDLVVNIQGDEPLIDPVIIDGIVLALQVFIWLANKPIRIIDGLLYFVHQMW